MDSDDDAVASLAQASQADHPERVDPGGRVPLTRALYYPTVPPWPATLIAPNRAELARWRQLWVGPQARDWTEPDQHRAVAALVRLEHRCRQARSSSAALEEWGRLRRELGLSS